MVSGYRFAPLSSTSRARLKGKRLSTRNPHLRGQSVASGVGNIEGYFFTFRTTLMDFRRTTSLAMAVLGIALALLLAQHWGMMLSNSDDPWIIRSTMAQVLETASAQGRFWLIPINLMAGVPYQLGSWAAANTVKIAVNGWVLIAFVVFCGRLTNRLVGVLMGLVWLALMDVSPGYYSPFHNFLMMFNLQFAVMFTSFALYLGQLDQPQRRDAIVLPFLLYAFSMLAYEPMFFYAAAFPAMFLYRHMQHQESPLGASEWRVLAQQFLRRNYPLGLVLVAYVVCFLGYRHLQPTPGRGLDFSGSLWDMALTVYRFSINGFHIQFKPLTNYLPDISSPRNLVLALAYATSIALGMLLVVPQLQGTRHPTRLYSKAALAILLFFVFCPNFLLALVPGYRQWAAEDPHYVGNYFSSFPLAMVVTLVLLHLVGGKRAAKEKVLFAAVLFLFFSSACDNYVRWSNLAEINRRDSQLWLQAIEQLKTTTFPQGRPSQICGRNAPEKVSGDDRYWSSYLSEVLRAPIAYTSKNFNTVSCDQVISFDDLRFPTKKP
jgi:hypothetical protein